MRQPDGRIRFLDGLRGIAITLVVLFHCYGPLWADFLPFGDRYANFVGFGWSGVYLFFLISGFVILMTLEKSRSLVDFASRRWLRLFPAMFVGSLIVLAFDRLFAAGPSADRNIINLLPGWLFASPTLIHALTRLQIESMDSPYWTIYIEVLFYAVFGISFFCFGRWRAIVVIFSLFAASIASAWAADAELLGGAVYRTVRFAESLGFIYFGWFASGALFYLGFCESSRPLFASAIATALISALAWRWTADPKDFVDTITLILILPIFVAPFLSMRVRSVLEWPALTFMGFVSYPLYLIHNNIAVGSTFLLSAYIPAATAALIPIPPILAVIAVSWGIARYLEPAMKRHLTALLRRPVWTTN